jgi:CRISPR-associated protein Csy2
MINLLISNMEIQHANIHNTSFMLGGPPLFAAYAFAHAMGRSVGFNVSGIALVHHEMNPRGQFMYGVFSPEQRRGAAFTFSSGHSKDYSSKNKHALSLQPVATAHMRMSIIVEIDELSDIEGVCDFLSTAKLSGGHIIDHGKPVVYESIEEAFSKKRSDRNVGIKNGFLVMDRRDLMEPRENKNQAELFVEAIGFKNDSQSWISAACIGYAAITNIEFREFSREGYPHAFAEPLIGLVQYRSLRDLDRKEIRSAMWRPKWETESAFCLKQ